MASKDLRKIRKNFTEREPSTARLPEVSEFDFTLQIDGQNYNIHINPALCGRSGGEK